MPTPYGYYRKHFIPLESSPDLFTELAHSLGLSTEYAFHDVLSLEDDELLALVPRPASALILVFPTSEEYDASIPGDEPDRDTHAAVCGEKEKEKEEEEEQVVMWYRQTINNACGLYAILHAICNANNNGGKSHIVPNSHLDQLIRKCTPLGRDERAKVLEEDAELEAAYTAVATRGDSAVPESAEDEVDFHYVCFVKSQKDGHLYEMDGDKNGPVDWGELGDDDVMSEQGRALVTEFVRRTGCDSGFSLLVLAPALSG